MLRIDADIAIIGSGFAGSLTALIARQIGLSPVLIDRARHPRFAIGESSTPIADMILRDLSDRYGLPRLRPFSTWGEWQRTYPHVTGGMKRGFSFYKHEPGRPFEPAPDHANELLVTASRDDEGSDTHWLRADVDAFFAEEVRHAGIPFFEDTRVAPEPTGRRWLLSGQTPGDDVQIRVSFLVDASGPGGVLTRALGIPDEVSRMRTHSRALYSHFRGVPRWQDRLDVRCTAAYPFPADWAALHHLLDGGWMWMLRFQNDVLSAGFMIDDVRHPFDERMSAGEEWQRWLARYPSLADSFAGAELVSPPGRLIRTSRLQRLASRAAGPNWALLPSAAGFVDALYSTGIAHSMCAVERLMRILERSWGDAAEPLERYDRAVRTEIDFVDRLVDLSYRSMDSFRQFTAASMLYFAVATCYEHARHAAGSDLFDRLFLLSDDAGLRRVLAESSRRARQIASDPNPDPAQVYDFERYLEHALEPYNRVGLFRPVVPNMYAYTAAPKAG